jgi:hypothetical protein
MYSDKYIDLAKRALEIYLNGAVNPIPLTRIISELMEESKAQGGCSINSSIYAPVRLILAQLNYLMGGGIGTYDKIDEDIQFVEGL